jgi:hypothetical protein
MGLVVVVVVVVVVILLLLVVAMRRWFVWPLSSGWMWYCSGGDSHCHPVGGGRGEGPKVGVRMVVVEVWASSLI